MIFECILLKMVRDTNDGRYLLFPGKFPSYPVRGKKILQPEGMHMVKQHSALFSQDTKADDTKSTKGG